MRAFKLFLFFNIWLFYSFCPTDSTQFYLFIIFTYSFIIIYLFLTLPNFSAVLSARISAIIF